MGNRFRNSKEKEPERQQVQFLVMYDPQNPRNAKLNLIGGGNVPLGEIIQVLGALRDGAIAELAVEASKRANPPTTEADKPAKENGT